MQPKLSWLLMLQSKQIEIFEIYILNAVEMLKYAFYFVSKLNRLMYLLSIFVVSFGSLFEDVVVQENDILEKVATKHCLSGAESSSSWAKKKPSTREQLDKEPAFIGEQVKLRTGCPSTYFNFVNYFMSYLASI
jgi:hypothetical protein